MGKRPLLTSYRYAPVAGDAAPTPASPAPTAARVTQAVNAATPAAPPPTYAKDCEDLPAYADATGADTDATVVITVGAAATATGANKVVDGLRLGTDGEFLRSLFVTGILGVPGMLLMCLCRRFVFTHAARCGRNIGFNVHIASILVLLGMFIASTCYPWNLYLEDLVQADPRALDATTLDALASGFDIEAVLTAHNYTLGDIGINTQVGDDDLASSLTFVNTHLPYFCADAENLSADDSWTGHMSWVVQLTLFVNMMCVLAGMWSYCRVRQVRARA